MKLGNLRNSSSIGYKCDRSSCLGNPYQITKELTREDSIALHNLFLYRVLVNGEEPSTILEANKESSEVISNSISFKYKIVTRKDFISRLATALRNEDGLLLCWCDPLPCHCNNYIKFYSALRIKVSSFPDIDKQYLYNLLDNYLLPYKEIKSKGKYLIYDEKEIYLKEYAANRQWDSILLPSSCLITSARLANHLIVIKKKDDTELDFYKRLARSYIQKEKIRFKLI
jgi:hypothetical protein